MYWLLDGKTLDELKEARMEHFSIRDSFLQLFQAMYVSIQAQAKGKDQAFIDLQNRNLQGISQYHNSADKLLSTLEAIMEDTQAGTGLSSDHIAQISCTRVLEYLAGEIGQVPGWNTERKVAIFRATQYAKALSDLLDYLTNIPADCTPESVIIEGKLFAIKSTHLEK